ncbi:uncharacterized protein LOC134825128 [Bolinopsis microptera]|uniref:uncharacterized protein LOC134825128 n=1 Tax=Bolinopsis microptera TaxID=2820187 RepID=UPI00307AD8E6
MNRLITPILSPCGSLIVRSKVTLQRRARTPEWHEKEGGSKTEKLEKLKNEHEVMKTQLKLLGDRLKEKNTVTSFRGVLVEKTLTKRVDDIEKDLVVERKAQSEKMPWWGYKRARPGHSKHDNFAFNIPRRSCYQPAKRKYNGSACTICKDHWYPMYTDVERIKKYINPETNQVIPVTVTGVCWYKQHVLEEAVYRAQSMGYLKPPIPPRKFNWSSADVYGRDRSELYGHRERYHQSYRHLPGNIHYQPGNPHWEHLPARTESVEPGFIGYE